MNDIGFGIVGCGAISAAHIHAVKATPGARLVAVADVVKERAESVASQHGCDAYDDYKEMLKRPDIHVINVCTGSGIHMEPAVAAAKAGKHVVVEKPLEVTLERADAIINACRDNNVKLACIFQSRFADKSQWLYKAVEEERFGRLVLADAYIKWYRSQEYYDQGAWRGTWRFDGGGALINQGIHSIDVMQWIMGPVLSVQAYTACLAHERVEVEDTAVAILHFASGALGVIEGATSIYPGYPRRLEIHGSKGSCVIVDDKIEELHSDSYSEEEIAQLKANGTAGQKTKAFQDPMAFSFEGHRRQIKDLVECIHTGRTPLVDGLQARKSVEIIMAIYASAISGQRVNLPLSVDPEEIRQIHAKYK